MSEEYKAQSKKVAQYYDQWQHGYDEVYGDMIQAFRPADKDELMKYVASSAGISAGQKILDAGCGVGGPAIWIAQHFDTKINGITVSQVQSDQARESVKKENLSDRIKICCGDYHELSSYFPSDHFDLILFLESLGHAGEPEKVISEAYKVIKAGGSIYIKDFYYKEPADAYWKERVAKTIENINRFYEYKTLDLTKTIKALRSAGFEIEFLRKFDFKDDTSIRAEFESRFNIDIFGGESEFAPAEWLEIKCTKPK